MKRYVDFLFYLFTRKKTVLANLFGAELQGQPLWLNYNGKRAIIYTDDGDENWKIGDVTVFYAAEIPPLELVKMVDVDGATILQFTQKTNMNTASIIVKETWKKRRLPPRIEPPFMFLLVLMGGFGLIELIASIVMYVWKYML